MDMKNLNQEQREAVMHTEGPLLILAGAGSGKTQTMTHRIAYLVEQGVSPYNILAVTFTNKAAAEMKERVYRLAGHCPGMWVMTFHAMSLRILRAHHTEAGYGPSFVVYDTVDQKTVMKNVLKDLNVDQKLYPVPLMLSVISKLKEQDTDPEEFLASEPNMPRTKTYYNIYKAYERELKKNDAMDFDDLLLRAYHLLRDHSEIRQEYRDRFRYIMVDEYQDTNHIQYEIIRLLASQHKNLCVVGDDDQAIYEWRGADIRNILDFERDFPGAKVVKLEQNYRSYKNILDCANSVIRNNRSRKSKKLWTDKGTGEKVVYCRLDTDKEEAEYVAKEIEFLLRLGKTEDDIAVLYRTNRQSRLFEDSLRKRKIPYQVLSGFSFYERKETKDMISYMRLVVNPKDDVALERIINEPKRGIGPTTFAKYKALAQVNGVSIFECLRDDDTLDSVPKKAREALRTMLDLIQECSDDMDSLSVTEIYDMLLVKTGYMPALEAEGTTEAEARIENLMDFRSYIYDYEKEKGDAGEQPSLSEFLERVSTQSDTDKYDEYAPKVTLMTLHSAKGLEFPVVFMPGMEDGLFPGFKSMDSDDGIEEERRLCYVGMTRAREKLILTSAGYRVNFGRGDYTKESMFLDEIDKRYLEVHGNAFRPSRREEERRLKTMDWELDGFAKPFRGAVATDPFRAVKEEIKKGNVTETLTPGDRVTHPKFGFGIVTGVTGKIVEVNFESVGTKKLALGLAPLKKV
ncbi:MAG: DUF3553 domain-containing protein [Clostridia bacterium]|nr:DUF3553 domain-containing protein [Clostridia bacterium]